MRRACWWWRPWQERCPPGLGVASMIVQTVRRPGARRDRRRTGQAHLQRPGDHDDRRRGHGRGNRLPGSRRRPVGCAPVTRGQERGDHILQPRTCSGGPGPPSTTWPPPPSTALASLAGQPALATAAAGGTRGARGASRSAHGARGGRGAGTTGHNSGTGSTGGTGGRGGGKGTGGGKGRGGAGDGGGGAGHGTTGGDKTPTPR